MATTNRSEAERARMLPGEPVPCKQAGPLHANHSFVLNSNTQTEQNHKRAWQESEAFSTGSLLADASRLVNN